MQENRLSTVDFPLLCLTTRGYGWYADVELIFDLSSLQTTPTCFRRDFSNPRFPPNISILVGKHRSWTDVCIWGWYLDAWPMPKWGQCNKKCKKHQGWKDAPRELAELQYTNPQNNSNRLKSNLVHCFLAMLFFYLFWVVFALALVRFSADTKPHAIYCIAKR